MSLAEELQRLPEGFEESTALITDLDDCLKTGFARLNSDQQERLSVLGGTLAGSPLAASLQQSIEAVGRSEFVPRHFCVLAAARAALQGAQYDSLRQQVLNRTRQDSCETTASAGAIPASVAAALGSVQQWLMEVALSGFQQLDEAAVAPFTATLENLQAESQVTGLASLLTGFVNELLRHMPIDRQSSVPVFRWADLWTAAMIRTQSVPEQLQESPVSGGVTLLGTDVRCHENFVAASVYGILEVDKELVSVRIPLTSYKVDAIRGPEIWDLFGDVGDALLKALGAGKSLKVEKAGLCSNGDLILKSKPRLSRAVDPFSLSDPLPLLPAIPPIARHPIQLAELVRIDQNHGLPIAEERLPADSEVTSKVLAGAEEIIGLLRFDNGGWRLQPLCVRAGKTTTITGQAIQKARAKLKSKTLVILRERSGKLLRG